MRGCVAYIHDPNTILTFDLKVKFTGFFYMFSCSADNYHFSFDIGLPNFSHACIPMRECVAYTHDPDSTLTFDLKVKFIGLRVRPVTSVCLTFAFIIWHMGLSPSEDVSRIFMICWYDVDLWPQGQMYRVYDMPLCSGHGFFLLWHSHKMFCTWVYHHGTMCRVHSCPIYDLVFWPQYQNYISP